MHGRRPQYRERERESRRGGAAPSRLGARRTDSRPRAAQSAPPRSPYSRFSRARSIDASCARPSHGCAWRWWPAGPHRPAVTRGMREQRPAPRAVRAAPRAVRADAERASGRAGRARGRACMPKPAPGRPHPPREGSAQRDGGGGGRRGPKAEPQPREPAGSAAQLHLQHLVQRDGAAREAAAEAADHNLPREGALLQARGARPSEAAHCGPAHTRGAALERARSSGRGSGVRRRSARAAGGERGAGARGPSAGRPVWSRRPTGGPRRKVAAARGNSDLGARQVGVEGAPSRSWRLASRTCGRWQVRVAPPPTRGA